MVKKMKCDACSALHAPGDVAYCVEQKEIYCKRCVGLLTYPRLKGNRQMSVKWSFERFSEQQRWRWTTWAVMRASVTFFCLAGLWSAGIDDDYFRGNSLCPTLSRGRRALARFDVNMFLSFKGALATYCDMEDSFWRLLLDAWIRGIVAGVDSMVLLSVTLMKAIAFKIALGALLRPIWGVIFATCSVVCESVLAIMCKTFPGWFCRICSAFEAFCEDVVLLREDWRAYLRRKPMMYERRTWAEWAKHCLFAYALSASARLVLHITGWTSVAFTSRNEVDIWQLVSETLLFWYAFVLLTRFESKLDDWYWHKPRKYVPSTEMRERSMEDIAEYICYRWERLMRTWNSYKDEADDVVHLLFDDVFYLAIVLRLVIIVFSLGPLLRQGAAMVGLGDVIRRHSERFTWATGVRIDSRGYVSDLLVSFGFSQVVRFGQHLPGDDVTRASNFAGLSGNSLFAVGVWRFAVPLAILHLTGCWVALLKSQRARFWHRWMGDNWRDGEYADQLERMGSFWNQVEREDFLPAV